MTDSDQLEAILGAVTKAMVGTGDALVVDAEKLLDGLAKADIPVTATTNRGALTAELSFLREELRTQRARLEHTTLTQDSIRIGELVRKMEAREDEIQKRLFPRR